MSSAFYMAGFEPWDVCMKDLLTGAITLEQFRGITAVGGFSYADVPESAKGWAATILFNLCLNKMFQDFYNRPDTFPLGVCNGCQLFGLLGWQGLCSADGRHLALMPHPERVFLPWQAHYLPEGMKTLPVSPWMKMFQNAYEWCQQTEK